MVDSVFYFAASDIVPAGADMNADKNTADPAPKEEEKDAGASHSNSNPFASRSDTNDDIKAEVAFRRDAEKYYTREKYMRKYTDYDRIHHGVLVENAKRAAKPDLHEMLFYFHVIVALGCLLILITVTTYEHTHEAILRVNNSTLAETATPSARIHEEVAHVFEHMAELEAGHLPDYDHDNDDQHEPFTRAAEQLKDYKIHYFPAKAVVDHLGDTYQLVRADHKRIKGDVSVECRVDTSKLARDDEKKWMCHDVSAKVPGATVWYVESDPRDGHWVHTLVVD